MLMQLKNYQIIIFFFSKYPNHLYNYENKINYGQSKENINNKSKKRNNIRITNYNINNNGNIFTYQKIFKNNESQNIDINRKNKFILFL